MGNFLLFFLSGLLLTATSEFRVTESRSTRSIKCSEEELFNAVKAHYGKIASGDFKTSTAFGPDCLSNSTKFCTPNTSPERASDLGYSKDDYKLGKKANLGLGCGNPVAAAKLKKGEVVVDMGSGTGFDAIIAAKEVGEKGRVVGVDITPEMVELAGKTAKEQGTTNVEFRLGQFENAPVSGNFADVVLSNCVFNVLYETHKEKALREAYRVLKFGGRLVLSTLLGRKIGRGVSKPRGECCYLGITMDTDMKSLLETAAFQNITIKSDPNAIPINQDGIRITSTLVFGTKL